LARERSASEYREAVETCLDTAQQMRRLTESLLNLAHLDADHDPIERRHLDLAEAVTTCLEHLRPLAETRGLQIHCDLAPASAFTNPDHLAQVITNLVTNAIHYNRPHGVIHVRTHTENGASVLTIADTGQGIAPEHLPHVFERFYRADKSRARADGHFGLGLAICKAILDAEGGRIEVASQLGVGTTFTMSLPS
jgi:two-component system, OmpR family, sensor kinase